MGRVHKKKIAQYNKENGDGAVDNSTNGDEKSSDRSRADSDADESIASSKKRTPKSASVPEPTEDKVEDDEEEQIDDIDRSEEKKQNNAEDEDKSDDEAEAAESTKSSPPAGGKKASLKRKSASRSKAADDDDDDDVEANGSTPAKKAATNKKNAGKKAKAKPKSKKAKPETEDEADEEEDEEDDEDDEKEYEVKDVVDHKTEKGVSYYLIRWKGYGPKDDTWEEEGTLSCQELIDKFNKKKKDTKSTKAKPASKKSAAAAKKGGKKATEDPEKQWEVDKIIDYSEEKKGRVFRIRWKGYAAKFDTWEPEANLNCDDLISKFLKKIDSQKDISYKELREEPKKTKRMVSEAYLKAERGARKSKRGGGKRIQYADSD